jgi:hypothetical protein
MSTPHSYRTDMTNFDNGIQNQCQNKFSGLNHSQELYKQCPSQLLHHHKSIFWAILRSITVHRLHIVGFSDYTASILRSEPYYTASGAYYTASGASIFRLHNIKNIFWAIPKWFFSDYTQYIVIQITQHHIITTSGYIVIQITQHHSIRSINFQITQHQYTN